MWFIDCSCTLHCLISSHVCCFCIYKSCTLKLGSIWFDFIVQSSGSMSIYLYLSIHLSMYLFILHSDNLTRVRLRPTGVKGADYINASFVDVSTETRLCPSDLLLPISTLLLLTDSFSFTAGLQASEGIHCHTRSIGVHCEWLLADDIRAQE